MRLASAKFLFIVSFICHLHAAELENTDTIAWGQILNSSITLVSSNGEFELGFAGSSNVTFFFLGVWFKKIPHRTLVWCANRDFPLSNPSAFLSFSSDGNLVISQGRITYAVTNSTSSNKNATVTLMDSGNLVLRHGVSRRILWQSFDFPTDTLLPGMKLGYDKLTGKTWSLDSWKSSGDPRPGAFSMKLDPNGTSQILIMLDTKIYWCSGLWNGSSFGLFPEYSLSTLRNITFVSNENETYLMFSGYVTKNSITRIVLDLSGQIKFETWAEGLQQWSVNWSQPKNTCDVYAYCGSFGVCDHSSESLCKCLPGFMPRFQRSWDTGSMSDGCVRRVPLGCFRKGNTEDGFRTVSMVALPVNPLVFLAETDMSCRSLCLKNCSCSSYAFDGGKCLVWGGDVINMKQLSENDKDRKVLYLRLAASEVVYTDSSTSWWVWLLVAVASILIVTTTLVLVYFVWRRKSQIVGEDLLLFDMHSRESSESVDMMKGGRKSNDVELPLFSFSSVASATENFSAANKLGEGGFGPVYKGTLMKGQQVAVKRLSKKSGQGWEELRNEATLIAKLQHKNLVRLLGCCLEKEEKILIYEYLSNKSLDFFLFDPRKRKLLDWASRVSIIKGIAQGLLYLHDYSRLRIIHRDLKASNILLDHHMSPKISDFGMARIFGGDGSVETNRIVGTYGYMSPEYAMEGVFSVKSDVYSFGVLLLEILTGKKNTGLCSTDAPNLLGHAWDMRKKGMEVEILDPVLEETAPPGEDVKRRYITVSLLCLQERAADRPTMQDVISMLTNGSQPLPIPKIPVSSLVRCMMGSDTTSTTLKWGSCDTH